MFDFLKRILLPFHHNKINIPADAPRFVQEYLLLFQNDLTPPKQTIADTRFIIFDTETTGLNVEKDQILSIGALAIEGNQIAVAQSFELFIQQDNIVGNEAVDVHGILKKGKKIKIPEREAIEQFLVFCKDSILIGHHVGFDVAMLNKHLQRNYGVKLHNRTLDTGFLARRVAFVDENYIMQQTEEMSLDHLAKKYNIDTSDRHRALGDAYITGVLFLKLIQRLKKRNITLLHELFQQKSFY
jgi:DNA polymerase III subunit epsilon